MITEGRLIRTITTHADELEVPLGSSIHKAALLAAMTYPETDWGRRYRAARFEAAYYRGGKFYRNHVPALVTEYEALAACSWGAWQQLYVTAYELGFREEPWKLVDYETAIQWVIEFLNARVFNTWLNAPDPGLRDPATKPEQVFDAWNSGSFRDRFIPGDYVMSGMDGYQEAKSYFEQNTITVTP